MVTRTLQKMDKYSPLTHRTAIPKGSPRTKIENGQVKYIELKKLSENKIHANTKQVKTIQN